MNDSLNLIVPKINYIDIGLMEKMCHPIAVAIFDTKEDPIAKFNEYEFALLDSALNNSKQTFGGQELYPNLVSKAAILYYTIVKNHPFKNGNKRIATASLLIFLFINDFWLEGDRKSVEDYLVNLAQNVANTKGDEGKDTILKNLENWLKQHIKKGR